MNKPVPPKNITPIKPTVSNAQLTKRHYLVLISFIVLVLLPALAVLSYLYLRAADQYLSVVGFVVHTEEGAPALEILGGVSLSSGNFSDTDILYKFIQSQQLVKEVNKKLDLERIYSQPSSDPIFSYDTDGTIEDLVKYWNRMVNVYYDDSTSLIEVRVRSFNPQDSHKITEEIFNQSSMIINELSKIARDDITRYTKEELDKAVNRLKIARQAITKFRTKTKIIDPKANVEGQVSLLIILQQQLAEALIDFDLLKDTTKSGDPRILQMSRKIKVIEAQIEKEREKFGISTEKENTEAYSELVGEYEVLTVDLEFAEQAYINALQAYDRAVAEAHRQNRYLAAYIKPTLAEKAEYPKRFSLFSVIILFLFLFWASMVLIVYSVRDRR